MRGSRRPGGRRTPRINRPSVLALEGRTLLAASPRLDSFAVPTPFAQPNQIVDGPDGDLWFNESYGKIGRITPRGQVAEIPLPTPSGGLNPALSGMTAGPDGNLWTVDAANDTIDRIGKDGQVATFAIPSNQEGGNSGSIVSGADGNLWFTTGLSNNALGWSTLGLLPNASLPGTIDRITPDGVLTQFALPLGDGVASSLAVGPDGIWFTDPLASRVGEIGYGGHVVEYSGPAPYYDGGASPLAIGPDGDAYYSTSGGSGLDSIIVKVAPGGAMTPIAIPGNIPSNSNMLGGSDGLYFVAQFSDDEPDALDRLNPDGTLSPISTNSALTEASGLAFGPDGNLWFAETFSSVIGRLDVSPAPEPVPGPTLVGSSLPGGLGTNGVSTPGLIAPVGEATTLKLADVRSSAGVKVDSATVDWGDGSTPTAGTLVFDTSGAFDTTFVDGLVSGSHAYAKYGSHTVTVKIDGTGPVGSPMTTSVVETAIAVDPTASPRPPLVLQAGKSIAYQGPLAIFSTPTPHDASGSDFTATVDWGDGSAPTAGTVVGGEEQAGPLMPPPFNPTPTYGPVTLFEVSGDHAYAKAGSFPLKVTLTDQFGHSSTESTSIQVEPGPLAINPTSPILATADPTPASSGSHQDSIDLGTLTDFLGTLAGRTYSVTVDWGDGSAPTAGSLLSGADTVNNTVTESIQGTHAYAKAGSHIVKITVDDNQGDSTEATTTILVSAGKLAVNPSQYSPTMPAGEPNSDLPLVTIAAPISADPPSDFTATVDWGDGSAPTAGTVATIAGTEVFTATGISYSHLQVSGDHTYAEPGLYRVTVTVDGPSGSTAQATPILQVSLDGVGSTFPATPSFTAGLASAPTVLGSFSPSGIGSGTAADFKATVDWGDGSPIQPAPIQPATPPQLGGNTLDVLGGHDYAKAGSYTVTLTVIGADGLPVVITSQATVATPITVAVPPPPPPVVVINPTPTPPTLTPIVSPEPTPTPTSPPVPPPSIHPVIGPIGPIVLPSHFPRFAPTLAKHHKPAAHPKAVKPAAHPKAVKPAAKHAEPSMKKAKPAHHLAAKPAHLAHSKKHPAGPARIAKPHR